MTHPIQRLLGVDEKRVIGLAPSAAHDAVDVALVGIAGWGLSATVRLLRARTVPLPEAHRAALEAVLDPGRPASAAELAGLGFRLGHALADAADLVLGGEPVDSVGTSGFTVWHQPPWMKTREDLPASTMQLGEPAVLAARLGCLVVGDFQAADMAAGGEGSPLLPYADWVLFRRPGGVRAIQTVGAVADVTVVGDRLADVLAFDTGPGSLLLGALAARADPDGDGRDRQGQLAARGRVLPDVLDRLLDDDYLRRPPPRTVPRGRYGRGFADALLASVPGADPVDLLATGVAFVVESIVRSYRAFVLPRLPVDEVLVSGEGVHNAVLLERLATLLAPLPVSAFDSGGIPAGAREAVAFALLAVEAVHASPANLPAATGARRPAVLGKLCLPPA